MPPADDDATVATEDAIAGDDTVAYDPDQPITAATTPKRVIRASKPSLPPTQLGRYAITRPLGRGGMGAVFEGQDPELGRRVAIKVLRDDRDAARFADNLRREAQALAKLVHPNVVGVYDVGVEGGRVYIVMQIVDGESIDRWLRARHARAAQIVAAFCQAGRGLAAAHAAGLVHRDVKPGNILVDMDGVARVTDFGLARAGGDDDESIAGTPSYMAPEQFTGVATAQSDQYSFCVALYEVLAGAAPFADAKLHDDEAARARVLPPMPRSARVSARVVRALQRGLANDPAARFPTMDALLAALAPPARRRWLVGAVAGTLAIGAAVVALAARTTPPATFGPAVPDLSAAHALTHNGTTACAYAPMIDGDRVVFDRTEREAVDLYMMPLAGGTPRQLTTASTWEWRAHPGRRPGEVLYLVHDPKDKTAGNVSYLDLATGGDSVAIDTNVTDAVPTNVGVVYIGHDGLELRRRDGPKDLEVVRAPAGMAFDQLVLSNRGDRIATVGYSSSFTGHPCLIEAAIGKLTCFDTVALAGRQAFGTDDRFLYYRGMAGIRRRELATGADTLLVADALPSGGLAIAGDGSALVYSDCGARAQVVDWSTQPPTVLVDEPTASAARGTGGSLVWLRKNRGVSVVMVRDRAGHERQVTDPEFGEVTALSISPDASLVAFRSEGPHPGLYVTGLAVRTVFSRISDDAQGVGPFWIGNQWLAFTRKSDGGSTVYVSMVDGSRLHALAPPTRWAFGGRDGKVFVASATRWYWLDITTDREVEGPDPGTMDMKSIVMSPGARWLVYRRGDQSQLIYRMSLDPLGKPEELPPVPAGQTLSDASITDDGHVLIIPATWSGDLHVVPAEAGSRF